MKDLKYRWNPLCLYDYRGVEEHLSAMAAKGWRLEKAGNTLWKYRRAGPASLRYAVTYNAGASQFNPGPTEGQESLAELCAAAGWEKVSDWAQAQIFSTEDQNAVPLETDEALRLENIHRSMKKSFLPGNIVLLALGLLMSYSFLGTLFVRPLRVFESNAKMFTGMLFLLVVLLEIYTLVHYCRWRKRSRRSIEEGGPCAPINTRAYQRLNRAGLGLVGILVVLYLLMELLGGSRGMAFFYVVYISLFALLVFLVRGTTALLRKLKASKSINIVVTLVVDFLLAFALVGGLTFGAIRSGWFTGGSGETYEYQHMEFDVHPREDLPLTLSDMTGEFYQHTKRTYRSEGSFFLPKRFYWEYAFQNTEDETVRPGSIHLSYTIYAPKGQVLYDALVKDLLTEEEPSLDFPEFGRVYRSADPAPWGAEAAYRQYYRLDGRAANDWLLCWPGRVAELSLDGPLTEDQKALAGARLGPEA